MAWRDWLLRAVAGDVAKLQIMYGASGERRLDEWEVEWLAGYEGSHPVRVGNAAAGQYQLDVYGEVMLALYSAARTEGVHSRAVWDLQVALIDFLEEGWREPDDGIWEVRGPRRHFTHSKVMAWVAVDAAIKTLEAWPELEAPSTSGERSATRSTPRCATKAGARSSRPSPSSTAPTSSTPASCSCRKSASCPPTTRG